MKGYVITVRDKNTNKRIKHFGIRRYIAFSNNMTALGKSVTEIASLKSNWRDLVDFSRKDIVVYDEKGRVL